MKLKKVCLLLCALLFLLLLNEISCIANYNPEENLIADEDRRAADSYEKNDLRSDATKRGLYESLGGHSKHEAYPSGYHDAGAVSSPGYSYTPALAHYPINPSYSGGHGSYGVFAPSGHGINYPSYGHHGSPAHGHEHGGHSALALKGLLIPLAGIALLGAAAALSTNPVLLQLGVVNGRRRRRRSFNSEPHPANPR